MSAISIFRDFCKHFALLIGSYKQDFTRSHSQGFPQTLDAIKELPHQLEFPFCKRLVLDEVR